MYIYHKESFPRLKYLSLYIYISLNIFSDLIESNEVFFKDWFIFKKIFTSNKARAGVSGFGPKLCIHIRYILHTYIYIYILYAQWYPAKISSAETNENSIFRFSRILFFELWSILYSKFIKKLTNKHIISMLHLQQSYLIEVMFAWCTAAFDRLY